MAYPNAVESDSGEGNGPNVRTGKDSTAANLIVEFFRKSTCKLLSFQDQSWPVCSRTQLLMYVSRTILHLCNTNETMPPPKKFTSQRHDVSASTPKASPFGRMAKTQGCD
jgi:hypothetical protein